MFGQGACNNQSSVTHHGYEYDIVAIGDQCWFAENCRYLPVVVVPPSSERSDEAAETDPYYYVIAYEGADVAEAQATENYATYGVLYNWSAVMTEGICPSGWHIPSDGDFTQLTDFLGGEIVAGHAMKSTSGWNNYGNGNNGNGSNSSGFNALPGAVGYRGGFTDCGYVGYWWSASESGSVSRVLYLSLLFDVVGRGSANRYRGHSARCVRD